GKEGNGLARTCGGARDGVLGRNPTEQGSVACTVGFDFGPAAPGEARSVCHWVCMGARLSEVSAYGQDLIIGRGPGVYIQRTRTYWQVWCGKDHRHIDEELGADVTQLYRRRILTVRAHAGNN